MLGCKATQLRSILRSGLVPYVQRNSKGHRMLEPWQIDLLHILLGMKQAGFKKADLKRYAQLFREGRQTATQRLNMLTTRKHQLWQEIAERQKAIDFIQRQEEIAWQKQKRRTH